MHIVIIKMLLAKVHNDPRITYNIREINSTFVPLTSLVFLHIKNVH